jgi:hypothetical protein
LHASGVLREPLAAKIPYKKSRRGEARRSATSLDGSIEASGAFREIDPEDDQSGEYPQQTPVRG